MKDSQVSGDERGDFVFKTLASFEMDSLACQTLRLRATYRELVRSGGDLQPYFDYIQGKKTWQSVLTGDFKEAYLAAKAHVYQVELGEITAPRWTTSSNGSSGRRMSEDIGRSSAGRRARRIRLPGGPAGPGDESFASDHKHFLYREYLHILGKFKPTIFVMENVKGLLSSKNGDSSMFQTILGDLKRLPGGASYEIRSLVVDAEPQDLEPSDFIIRSEEYGVPQKRHRVILLGVRSDVAAVRSSTGSNKGGRGSHGSSRRPDDAQRASADFEEPAEDRSGLASCTSRGLERSANEEGGSKVDPVKAGTSRRR
jgi:DNA (cytosine-5)-methyltransferase 1